MAAIIPALLLLTAIAAALRLLVKPIEEAPTRRRLRMRKRPRKPLRPIFSLLVFPILGVMVLLHNHHNPHWTPHGFEWERWYHSALAMRSELPYPSYRYPLYAFFGSLADSLTSQPLHVNLQLLSLIAGAATVAGIGKLAWRLIGAAGGTAAMILAILSPMTLEISGWIGAYSLHAAFVLWFIYAISSAAATGGRGWWFAAGTFWAGSLTTMPESLLFGSTTLPLFLLAAFARKGDGLRGVGANLFTAAIPVALAFVAYSQFPTQLSGPGYSSASSESFAPGAVENLDQGELQRAAPVEGDGYVFGQRTTPANIARAFTGIGAAHPTENTAGRSVRDQLDRALPSRSAAIPFMVAGGLVFAVIAAIRRGKRKEVLTWLSVSTVLFGAAIANTRPLVELHLLAPAFPFAGMLLVAPIAIISREGSRWWIRSFPLLAVPVLLSFGGSPWVNHTPARAELRQGELDATIPFRIIHELNKIDVSGPFELLTPPFIGLIIIEEMGGRLLTPDSRFNPRQGPIHLNPNNLVLLSRDEGLMERSQGRDPFGPGQLTNFVGRESWGHWPGEDGSWIELLGRAPPPDHNPTGDFHDIQEAPTNDFFRPSTELPGAGR